MKNVDEKVLINAVDTAVESILSVKEINTEVIYPVLIDTIEHVFGELAVLDKGFHPLGIIGPLFEQMEEFAFPLYITLGKALSENSEHFKEALASNVQTILEYFRGEDDTDEEEEENFEENFEDTSSKENLLLEMKDKIGRVLDILFSSGHAEQDASNLVSAFASGAKTLEARTNGGITIPKLIVPLLLAFGNPRKCLEDISFALEEMFSKDFSVDIFKSEDESEVC